MLQENIKNYRKSKGFSQEELAARLNVVRQTVSKWEKGYSVPDADMLSRIAEVFEVPVSKLLSDAVVETESELNIAEALSRINEQLAIKNRRSKKIWKIVGWILVVILVLLIINAAA